MTKVWVLAEPAAVFDNECSFYAGYVWDLDDQNDDCFRATPFESKELAAEYIRAIANMPFAVTNYDGTQHLWFSW